MTCAPMSTYISEGAGQPEREALTAVRPVEQEQPGHGPLHGVDEIVRPDGGSRLVLAQRGSVHEQPDEAHEDHEQVQDQQQGDVAWHFPAEVLATAGGSPSRDDEKEQQVPGVEALHAEQRVGHVRVLDDSGEQNQATEPPIPVLERIDRDDQHEQPQQGQSNHAGARSSMRLVGPPRLSPVGRGRDARSQIASGEPLSITSLRQRPRSLSRVRIAPGVRETLTAVADAQAMRRGSLSERWVKCSRSGCPCSEKPDARHGPYFSLTRMIAGRTRSRLLTAEGRDRASANRCRAPLPQAPRGPLAGL